MRRDSPTELSVMRGATVLITGAGRGMGGLYVKKALKAGAKNIALWDIDVEASERVISGLKHPGVNLKSYGVNIANLQEIKEAAKQVAYDFGDVDIVINNAGIVRGFPFWDHDPETDIELTMQVNALAPMWITRELLPSMMSDRSRTKRILNIASAAGTLANPNMSVYAASKWAMIGWGESLRLELKNDQHSHIKVTTFCPSYISTGMFAGVRGPLLTPIMKPNTAVNAAWSGMIKGTPLINKPWTVKLALALRGVLPTQLWDLIADKVFHVYSSMDNFTGRNK